MGESDWWLCGQCRSLNNLSAGKCYSCHRSKPKDSQRASAFLGYEPVVTRDGKVRLDFPTPSADEPASDALAAASQMVPLRDPIPRSITDVAPRVPHGARIVYRLHEPPMPPRPRCTTPFAPAPPMAAPRPAPWSPAPGWRPAPRPPGAPAMPPAMPRPPVAGPFPGPRPVVGMPVGRPAMVGVPVAQGRPPGAPEPWPGPAGPAPGPIPPPRPPRRRPRSPSDARRLGRDRSAGRLATHARS